MGHCVSGEEDLINWQVYVLRENEVMSGRNLLGQSLLSLGVALLRRGARAVGERCQLPMCDGGNVCLPLLTHWLCSYLVGSHVLS